MSFPRYPKYKDSGVEWLGEVPEGWDCRPIKHLGKLKGGAGFPHDEQGIDWEELSFHKVNALAQADSRGDLLPSENTISRMTASRLGAYIFPSQSIVFAKVGAALLLGRIRCLKAEACIDNNMMGLVVYSDYSPRFVMYALLLVRFDLIANPGAVPSLNEGQIGNFIVSCPSLEEQQAIAVFLDRETAKIDALVAEQENLIALLKEKRQAVISHAVTKGLDPTVPMKDSGIEWLGEVPAHWQVLKLTKCITSIVDYRGKTPTKVDDGVFLLTARNIRNGSIDYEVSQEFVSEDEYEEVMRRGIPTVGDLLLTMEAPLGQVANVDRTDIAIAQRIIKLQGAANTTNNYYLKWWFMGTYSQAQLSSLATGSTALGLKASKLGQLDVCLPPSDEQRHVVMFLDTETAKLDDLTTEAHHTIDLLKERRSALISAAVTGKINVRGYLVHSQPTT